MNGDSSHYIYLYNIQFYEYILSVINTKLVFVQADGRLKFGHHTNEIFIYDDYLLL